LATRILFRHGASDRIQAASDWIARHWVPEETLLVYAPDPAIADRLDRQLWLQPPTGFVPHCRAGSPLQAESAVVIAGRIDPATAAARLVNLSDEVPPGFADFDELVEIVSTDDGVRLPARERFKFYRERGHEPTSEDVSGGR